MVWWSEGKETIPKLNLSVFMSDMTVVSKSDQNALHPLPDEAMQAKRELKILIKYREIFNVKSTNSLGVIIDNNLSWEVHIERTCSRTSHNLFLINRQKKYYL
jgi:hypothetical protein